MNLGGGRLINDQELCDRQHICQVKDTDRPRKRILEVFMIVGLISKWYPVAVRGIRDLQKIVVAPPP